jgi:hypothetical protein
MSCVNLVWLLYSYDLRSDMPHLQKPRKQVRRTPTRKGNQAPSGNFSSVAAVLTERSMGRDTGPKDDVQSSKD